MEAESAILMDRHSGIVLWAHNADIERPMASTTKIMTAMVILDHGAARLDEKVRVSAKAASTGGSWVFKEGDVTTLRNLLIAALIRSSNEATVAAAEYLAGDEQTFVGWMNEKATRELGLKHTHFVNPHGLYDKMRGKEHYTTARELAMITRYALAHYPLIREIIVMGPVKIDVQPYKWKVLLENHDKIVNQPVPGIPDAVIDGVKTGFVVPSGRCLVSSATCHGWQLIAVVLKSPSMFQENMTLLHYGFSRFAWRSYAEPGQASAQARVRWGAARTVPVGAASLLGVPIPKEGDPVRDEVVFREKPGKPLQAPVRKGQVVGTLELHRNGKTIMTTQAIALDGVPIAWWVYALLGLMFVGLFVVCFVVLEQLYGTRAKITRRRRRVVATSGGKTHRGRQDQC